MRVKQSMLAAVLCLSSIGLVQAKSHHITLSEPTMAGSTLLPAGNYTVKVEGTNAVLLNMDKDQTYTAPVKVESDAKKFDQTAVLTNSANGESRIQAIEVGGSHERLQFDQ
ncbi:MAG: hypothetical protein ABI806_12385 [Candidatus Solibacter sp.]